MRIIRNLAVLALIIVPIMPNIALAADGESSNETQINLNTNNNLIMDNGIIKPSLIIADSTYNLDGSEGFSAKTPREIEIETVMARYEDKRRDYDFPEGKFEINASAYTAAADECGKGDGVTASGLKVQEGETIACPPQFPLGTKLNIEGLGTRICEDRGGAIRGNHVDVYVERKSDAFKFGRKKLLAEVVK